MIVAIDGPSGAGKSTVARAVAAALGFSYLDTGAMYRSVALKALERGCDLEDSAALGALAQTLDLRFEPGEDGDRVLVDGVDVTREIRTPEVDRAVSPVSAAPSVRAAMTELQRRIGNAGDFVVEGRDIATTVFPEAELKVFMTASAEERARRRLIQNEERGIASESLEELKAAIERRDAYDSAREVSPLRAAADARRLDTTAMELDEVVATIVEWAREVSR